MKQKLHYVLSNLYCVLSNLVMNNTEDNTTVYVKNAINTIEILLKELNVSDSNILDNIIKSKEDDNK